MKRKSIALLLALVMCLGLTTPAFAEEKVFDFYEEGDVTINSNGTIRYTGDRDNQEEFYNNGLLYECFYALLDMAGGAVSPISVIFEESGITITADANGTISYTGTGELKQYIVQAGLEVFSTSIGNEESNLKKLDAISINIAPGLTILDEYETIYPTGKNHNGRDIYASCDLEGLMSNVSETWGLPVYVNTSAAPAQSSVTTVGGFTDVKQGDYFADPVLWAVEKGITSGTSATTFSPSTNCTVAQILTFLWRANGSPTPAGSNPFSDVKDNDYYYGAALWAYEKGMVSGGTFNGSNPCTRSMAVTYMWKATGSPAASGSKFTDVPAGADYASAVAWAVEKGVTSGTSATTFSPDSVCTRGQIVTFLYRGFAK